MLREDATLLEEDASHGLAGEAFTETLLVDELVDDDVLDDEEHGSDHDRDDDDTAESDE